MINKKLLLILLLSGMLLFLFNLINPLLLWDENAYLGNARSHLDISNYTEDFRFPLLEWIIASIWFFTGESIFIAKLVIISISLLTIFFVYKISKELFPKKEFLITSIYAFSYLVLYWGFRVYNELTMLLFILISFYLIIKKKYFWAGFFSGLAFLARFTSALFPFSVVIFFIYRRKFRDILLFSIGLLSPLIPWGISNYIHHKNILWDFIEQYKIVEAYTTKQYYFLALKRLSSILGVLIIFLPFGIYSILKNINNQEYRKKNYEILFIFCLISLIYIIFFINIKYSRYFFQVLPFLFFVCYEGFLFLKEKLKNNRATLILNLIILSFVIINLLIVNTVIINEGICNRKGAIKQSIDYLRPFVSENDTIISNHWPYFGYYLNAKVSSIWINDSKILIDLHHPRYFVINNRLGDEVKPEFFSLANVRLEKEISDKCQLKSFVYKVDY